MSSETSDQIPPNAHASNFVQLSHSDVLELVEASSLQCSKFGVYLGIHSELLYCLDCSELSLFDQAGFETSFSWHYIQGGRLGVFARHPTTLALSIDC